MFVVIEVNSIESLFSLMFFLIVSLYLYSLPPNHFYFSHYHYALVNDYVNVFEERNSLTNENLIEDLNLLDDLRGSCSSLSVNGANLKHCNYVSDVYSTNRCIFDPVKRCYLLSIGA